MKRTFAIGCVALSAVCLFVGHVSARTVEISRGLAGSALVVEVGCCLEEDIRGLGRLPADVSCERSCETDGSDRVLRFALRNNGRKEAVLEEGSFGFVFPFDSVFARGRKDSLDAACVAHVWCGGDVAWVWAGRPNGTNRYFSAVLTEGRLSSYSLHCDASRVSTGAFYRGSPVMNPPRLRTALIAHADDILRRRGETQSAEVTVTHGGPNLRGSILAQAYELSHDPRYRDELEAELHRAESFYALQPDARLCAQPVRHWDGFWFGGARLYGDTFPQWLGALNGEMLWRAQRVLGRSYETLWRTNLKGCFRPSRPTALPPALTIRSRRRLLSRTVERLLRLRLPELGAAASGMTGRTIRTGRFTSPCAF